VTSRDGVVIVAGEPLWPPTHGGRVRTAAIAEELARHTQVDVLMPGLEEQPVVRGLQCVAYPAVGPAPVATRLTSTRPRLGIDVLRTEASRSVGRFLAERGPAAVLYAHSYLAAAVDDDAGARRIVDFPDLERRRMASFARARVGKHRLSAAFEAAKAARWERRVAQNAGLCLAVTPDDVRTLEYDASRVFLVPNSVQVDGSSPALSPTHGVATYFASATYGPNREGGDYLLREVWPEVLRRSSTARLRIAGRGSAETFAWAAGHERVEVIGEIADPTQLFHNAACMLAPVKSGGGTQLKVVEGLGRGRAVVATPFSAGSVPEGFAWAARIGATAQEFAQHLIDLLADVDTRHALERRLIVHRDRMGWRTACAPLVRWLVEQEAQGGGRSPA